MTRTLGFKLGAIALLILLLLIPLLMIDGLIDERQQARNGVLENIAQSSSYSQQVTGPILVVPYRRVIREWKTNEKTGQRYLDEKRNAAACSSCRSACAWPARWTPSCVPGASTRRGCTER